MVNDGSAADIFYLNVYKRTGLTDSDLNPTASPLYKFTRNHVVPKGTTKLTVMVGEQPRMSMVIINFLIELTTYQPSMG